MEQEFKYEVINNIGIIAEYNKWRKEFNRISWQGNEPKYDIRDWSKDHQKIGKGITLSESELRILSKLINDEIKLLDEK